MLTVITSYLGTFVTAIQFMPTCIMYVVLCPDGSEGTTYALLTTMRYIGVVNFVCILKEMNYMIFCSNLASTVASDIASWMTKIWNVSNSA